MMSSPDVELQAAARLQEIAQRLDPQYLAATIEAPLDALVADMTASVADCDSFSSLLSLMVRFVQSAHCSALPWPRTLSLDHALDLVIELIDRGYVSARGRGCDALWADVLCEADAVLRPACESIARALKTQLRDEYRRWLADRYVRTLPWPIRRVMATHLLVSYEMDLPPQLAALTSGQVAGGLFELLETIVAVAGVPLVFTGVPNDAIVAACAGVR